MPKVLSLKKAKTAAPPRNQKSITHFFKNVNVGSIQKQQNSPEKNQFSQTNVLNKRKATSPVNLETFGTVDDYNVNGELGSCSTHALQKNGHNIPKKCKSDHGILQKSQKIVVVKKSPQKENSLSLKLSSGLDKDSSCKSTRQTAIESETESLHSRLPLTPIKDCNDGVYSHANKLCSDKKNNQRSSQDNQNHVQIIEKTVTPKKVINFDYCSQNSTQSNKNVTTPKKNTTPKKSPDKESQCPARVAQLKTPDKLAQDDLSPSKSGSTVKTLKFSPNTLDGFGDQWNVDDFDENGVEDLDLASMQRCEVLSVTQHQGRLELRLKNNNNNRGTCFVEGVWLDTPLVPGETVSVLGARNSAGQFYVGSSAGLLVLRPDHLLSSTTVVGGVFCKRKALLQERYRGLDSGNTAMTIGILIHELVQKALTENITDVTELRAEADRIVKESLQMLYDTGINEEEARNNMQQYIAPLAEFMHTYVVKSPLSKQPQKDQWVGHVEKVLDIEENLCCPQLGLKGKIDATLQVTIHEQNRRKRCTVPLELKSGKASVSAEHRGQLVLYGMMLSATRGHDPATADNSGLLLYLKERVDVRDVRCGYPERRDLVLLRNQLVQHLALAPRDIDTEELTDIEEAACLLQQRLPEPVHHHSACAKCPYLTLCQLHLWHTEGPSVSDSHPLSKLRESSLGHLSACYIEYFLHWSALLRVEERAQSSAAPLKALWTDSAEKRAKRGTCAANLKLKFVEQSHERYLHCFERQIKEIDTLNANKSQCGPQEGEFSIVSVSERPWLAAGVVTMSTPHDLHILLERDLSRRLNKETLFHVDTYESYATTVHNLTNLGVLLEDSERSSRLRRLIIDREPPEFEKKLAREVGRLGSKLMRGLNIEQQRAVLRALAATDYALLRGLPGTGKTQTISVLIQMLVGMKQRVLVTAHTHSAVDNVLSRLPQSLKVLRLGSSARVAANLKNRSEEELVKKCKDVKELEEMYDSMEVVGVTCLGAAHAMLTRTTFDVCVVDEATQVLQPTVLRPLFAARRFVLVGDPDQLPPVVRSRAARRLGMEESLFHRLMTEETTTTLQLQYRMNQPLVDIANKVAYRDRLKCADEKVALATLGVDIKCLSLEPCWLQKACSPEPDLAALFLDVSTDKVVNRHSKQCTNVAEACVVMAIVDALIQSGLNPSAVGVIAPYRDQVSLLRRAVAARGAECSTVDQFQGRDKPAILYSCTKTEYQLSTLKEGEILNDQRRLAVSVTRAKHKLIVIGNSLALQRYLPLQRVIEACKRLSINKQDLDYVEDKYKNIFL